MLKLKRITPFLLISVVFAAGCSKSVAPSNNSNSPAPANTAKTETTAPANTEKPSAESNYKFKVTNTTDETIVKLMASEDGKSYGFFDIGSPLEPGKTIELVWDKKTDNSDCEWFFTAEFKGGEKSKPVKFDFCEDNLELEFK